MNEIILNEIKDLLGGANVSLNEIMEPHLSMRVGGPADYYFTPENIEQCAGLIKILNENNIPYYVLGNATNVIIRDLGFRGAIVHIRDKMSEVTVSEEKVTAQAGIKLKDLADIICRESLTGFEFASGIPGSLGGAVTMNAGAYGGEMKDVVESVTVIDRQGRIREVKAEDADFSYRHSAFSSGDYLVVSAVLRLKKGNISEIQALMDELNARRADKQPLEYPSCGSTFKRPEGYFAGKLIMDSGLAGARVGGASVSRKHCGFVINDQGGTATDVLGLIKLIQRTVKEKFGVELECEVKVL